MLRPATLLTRLGVAALGALCSACSGIQYFLANAPAAFGPFERKADLTYGEDARQRLDLFVPDGARGRPVVIFWYGGSWQSGSKSDYRFVAAALARRGFVVAVPDYRLYPAVKFPAFLDDAAQAVVWIQQHVQQHGGDPQRIVLMGHSAGAHIAAFVALNHEFLRAAGGEPRSIRGLVGLSGPYALDPDTDVLRAIFAAPYTLADWQPVQFVDERAPPTLLMHGMNDTVVAPRHAELLRDALVARQVRVEMQFLPARNHADTVAAFALGARHRAPVLERVTRFIESVNASPSSSMISSSASLRTSAAPPGARRPRTGQSR